MHLSKDPKSILDFYINKMKSKSIIEVKILDSKHLVLLRDARIGQTGKAVLQLGFPNP